MFNFLKPQELGNCYIAIAGAKEWRDWRIKIAENYEDPLGFCRHALFIFEDLTYIVERGLFAVDSHTGLKKEIKAILEDVQVCLRVLYHSRARLLKSPFAIGDERTDTLGPLLDLLHESKLYQKLGKLHCQRTQFQCPGWPACAPFHAAAVFAVFDHMVMKIARTYRARDLRHLRVLYGVETIVRIAESAGMFGSIGLLEETGFGKLPRSAIREMDSLTDEQLERRYAEQIPPEIEDIVRDMPAEEVRAFIQALLSPQEEKPRP